MRPPAILRRAALPAFLLASVAALPLSAFEGWEHQLVGNIAIEAVEHKWHRLAAGSPQQARIEQALDMLAKFRSGLMPRLQPGQAALPPLTYGHLIRAVDYIPDNYDLLYRELGGRGLPTGEANTAVRHFQEMLDEKMSLPLFGSSHANQNHFQGRALTAFRTAHAEAVATAAAGNLWAALLFNAYGDHFLQDTFAPGHLLALRDHSSHDLVATMLHDGGNIYGMTYVVGDPAACHEAFAALRALPQKEFSWTERRKWLGPKAHKIVLSDKVLDDMAAATQPIRVKCHGDGLLEFGFGEASDTEAARQVALIAAYCFKSIDDVVASHVYGRAENSFTDITWKADYGITGPSTLFVLADYRQQWGRLTAEARYLDPSIREIAYPDERTGRRTTLDPSDSEKDIISDFRTLARTNPAFGLTWGGQVVEAGGTHFRTLLDLEILVRGARWDHLPKTFREPWQKDWPGQCALTLGTSAVLSGPTKALGPQARLVVPVPYLNLQISALVGVRHHWFSANTDWASYYGVRMEWGMHLSNLFLGIGRDHHPTGDRLRGGFRYEGGLSLALPRSRIPLLNKLADRKRQ